MIMWKRQLISIRIFSIIVQVLHDCWFSFESLFLGMLGEIQAGGKAPEAAYLICIERH